MKKKFFIAFTLCVFYTACFSQVDTLRIMTYNVLHYGDGCQGTNGYLHSKLETIMQYAKPDVLGLVKVQAIKLNAADTNGISPVGFADSIAAGGLNAAYPNTYTYCPLTNVSNAPDDDMDILFYNKNKLGFASVTNLCAIQEDFDLYKLYYKSPYLSTTQDTTFLYIILNHTISGNSSPGRDHQDSVIVQGLKQRFTHLPNLIDMGDLNTHTSTEPGYELLTTTADTSFLFYDPPFHPDNALTYPINWGSNPSACSAYLNVSTRKSSSVPNNCGTNGGADVWYLHILLSNAIVHNFNNVKYVPHSYTTLGNDGHRLNIAVNDNTTNGTNTSAPANVLDALFYFSDKYPILVKLAVTYSATTNSIDKITSINNQINIYPNPSNGLFNVSINQFHNQTNRIEIYNAAGACVYKNMAASPDCKIDISNLPFGIYNLIFTGNEGVANKRVVITK